MADDPTTLTPESDTPSANGMAAPAGGESAFLIRARRILAGDIRPDDYLPVTPEVRRRVDLFMDLARGRANGQTIAPQEEPRQVKEELLSFHHGGENIAYIEDERGVVELGVGLEQGAALLDAFPYELRKDVGFGAPPPRDTVVIY
jgi:hypothetical protein